MSDTDAEILHVVEHLQLIANVAGIGFEHMVKTVFIELLLPSQRLHQILVQRHILSN
jgi:hypothetical protein